MTPQGVQEVLHVARHHTHMLHRSSVSAGPLDESVNEIQVAEEQLLVEFDQLLSEVCTVSQ